MVIVTLSVNPAKAVVPPPYAKVTVVSLRVSPVNALLLVNETVQVRPEKLLFEWVIDEVRFLTLKPFIVKVIDLLSLPVCIVWDVVAADKTADG